MSNCGTVDQENKVTLCGLSLGILLLGRWVENDLLRLLAPSPTAYFFGRWSSMGWREGIVGWTVRWVKNWLGHQAQRVLVKSLMSRWRLKNNQSNLGLILRHNMIICIRLGWWHKCTLSQSVDDIRLDTVADMINSSVQSRGTWEIWVLCQPQP